MKSESIITSKSFQFALKIVRANQLIIKSNKDNVLSKQLFRSGTSIGANVVESGGAYSKKDFEFKLSIAYKEAKETAYWLKLIEANDLLGKDELSDLHDGVEELQRLIGSAIITLRKNATK
jgi:four helix bundle protein